jgi:hypothetical protein
MGRPTGWPLWLCRSRIRRPRCAALNTVPCAKHRAVYVRKEVRKVVLPSPRDGVSPTVFGGFGDDAVVDLEGQVRLRLETLDRLVKPRK